MIGLVDYGVGNIGSLRFAFDRIGLPVTVSREPEVLDMCDGILLPGVGAFAPAAERLIELELVRYLRDWAAKGRSLLGICLGMQLLFERSEEGRPAPGLGLLSGTVTKLATTNRSSHVGWNRVVDTRSNMPSHYAYFVHSYACHPSDLAIVQATTTYGATFPAIVTRQNVSGCQFHPEKSGEFGLDILRRWARGEL